MDSRIIADLIPNIVWVVHHDGSTAYVNRQGMLFAGQLRDDDRWAFLDLVHPDELDAARAELDRAVAAETPYRAEHRLRRADGHFRWHACDGVPAPQTDDTNLRWVFTATDIEHRKRLRNEIRSVSRTRAATTMLLNALHATAPVGLGFIDRDLRVERVNTVLAAVSGASTRDQLGRRLDELGSGMWSELEPLCRQILDGGEEPVNIEILAPAVDGPGRRRNWLVSLYPVRMADEVVGIGVAAVDVAESSGIERSRGRFVEAVVDSIAATLDERDPYTAQHQRRVAKIAVAIAREMGIDEQHVTGIGLAARIHDIGKSGVPLEILTRPGALRESEWDLLKGHSRAGHDIVAGLDLDWPVAEMILQHHERLDGSGYPSGLEGDEVILGARVIAVADTLEAMTAHRPYRPAKGIQAAVAVLETGRGIVYDSTVVDACLSLHRNNRISFEHAS